jgi:hypothetical protein
MKRERKLPFDPKVFLSKVNGGRAISDYRKDQIVYTQGEPADFVFYIQSGFVAKYPSSIALRKRNRDRLRGVATTGAATTMVGYQNASLYHQTRQ